MLLGNVPLAKYYMIHPKWPPTFSFECMLCYHYRRFMDIRLWRLFQIINSSNILVGVVGTTVGASVYNLSRRATIEHRDVKTPPLKSRRSHAVRTHYLGKFEEVTESLIGKPISGHVYCIVVVQDERGLEEQANRQTHPTI